MINLDNNLLSEHEELNDNEVLEPITRTAIECLCPKCGQRHLMNIHWIGRGVPRKFCKSCRSMAHDYL